MTDLRHPEADLRGWLAKHGTSLNAYTSERIARSYEGIEHALRVCPEPSRRSLYDVGSGAGFDSFAWAAHFDRVVAVDTSRRAIAEARRIAKAAAIRHVEFHLANAEREAPAETFDVVWCNLMSHHGQSRRALLARMAATLAPGGRLIYSEVCEGYPVKAAERALAERDAPELGGRIRQALNGVLSRPGLRFFLSGSAPAELAAVGIDVAEVGEASWAGSITEERYVATKTGDTFPSGVAEGDYSTAPAALEHLRDAVRCALEPGSTDAAVPPSGLVALAAMAPSVLPRLSPAPSLAERLAWRLPRALRMTAAPDWEHLDALWASARVPPQADAWVDRHAFVDRPPA